VLKNIVWLSRKYNYKNVGFMAPLAKKVPDPCSSTIEWGVTDLLSSRKIDTNAHAQCEISK